MNERWINRLAHPPALGNEYEIMYRCKLEFKQRNGNQKNPQESSSISSHESFACID